MRYPIKTAFVAFALLLSRNLLAQQQDTKVRMALPGVKGVLEMDMGTPVTQMSVRPDGKEVQVQALHRPDDLVVSAYLHQVEFSASAETCRDQWWPATEIASPRLENLEKSLKDGLARVAYDAPVPYNVSQLSKTVTDWDFGARAEKVRHVHAYLGNRNICAEIDLLKPNFKPADEQVLDQVLASAKLLPDELKDIPMPPPEDEYPASHTFFAKGRKSYLQGNYVAAAESYQRALDLEKQTRTFPPDQFRLLINDLGISYGTTGKLLQAKQVFEYGISQGPDVSFYYNLACTYGEMGKMDEAISELRNAYSYKSRFIKTLQETLPDPLKDDSFRKFAHNEKFASAVAAMQ